MWVLPYVNRWPASCLSFWPYSLVSKAYGNGHAVGTKVEIEIDY
jgi:hypothetical protein